MTHTLKIDLVSDVVCPWCAIGYKRLQQAIELLDGEIDVEIEWHAFLLNPDVPPEGTPILEHLMHKYGKSEAEIHATQQMIVETAQGLGLDFSHATDRRSWNTFHVHRVLAWAKEHGKYTEFKLALFDAYFGQAKDPTDPALLKQIAGSLDLDREQVDAILGSDLYAAEVEQELAYYRSAGVSSVPSFVVDNQYLLAGAQEPQMLANAFREIASNTAVAG